jgi:deoxyribodipyrimidine photo-lyase
LADPPPIIVWFRNELRLQDHPALVAAAGTGSPILPLFILDDVTPGRFRRGGASRWWLHGSLAALDGSLRKHGGALCLRKGRAPEVLNDIFTQTGATDLHVTRGYEPWESALTGELAGLCIARGARLASFGGNLLFEPEAMLAAGGKPYRLFTPFFRAALKACPPAPLPVPKRMAFARAGTDRLEDWNLRPTKPDWAAGLREGWLPGEMAASNKLAAFLAEGIAAYAAKRDRLDLDATSRLSPHLHFGEVSPAQVWHAVARSTASGKEGRGAESFLRELVWRDFSHHQLFHFPHMASEPLKPGFDAFPWRDDPHALRAWQQGRTGYPIVDAAMRELWQTGFMPNRARMIAASFLTKHLLIPWQKGADWFLDTLVDADLANNSANWQWVAGSGVDAAPYFRIFNPVLQARKFDPSGDYVRRWVLELAALPASHIHAPWQAPASLLAEAGVSLGETYPKPIVDHAAARARALAAFATLRR